MLGEYLANGPNMSGTRTGVRPEYPEIGCLCDAKTQLNPYIDRNQPLLLRLLASNHLMVPRNAVARLDAHRFNSVVLLAIVVMTSSASSASSAATQWSDAIV